MSVPSGWGWPQAVIAPHHSHPPRPGTSQRSRGAGMPPRRVMRQHRRHRPHGNPEVVVPAQAATSAAPPAAARPSRRRVARARDVARTTRPASRRRPPAPGRASAAPPARAARGPCVEARLSERRCDAPMIDAFRKCAPQVTRGSCAEPLGIGRWSEHNQRPAPQRSPTRRQHRRQRTALPRRARKYGIKSRRNGFIAAARPSHTPAVAASTAPIGQPRRHTPAPSRRS